MSTNFELGHVDRITAGAIGEPGQRTFFIQARAGSQLVTLLSEKEQVQALATHLQTLMDALPDIGEEGFEPEPSDLDLEEPAVAEWRVGSMALAHDDESGRISIVIEEAVPEDSELEPATARLEATRAQVRAFAERALEVVAAGRPRCHLCGFPIDPEGHRCPALNGHRTIES